MKWIGISRNDPEQRKFEFDDSVVLKSDPPQYSIRFLDNNEITSTLCSDVFKLKPVKPFKKMENVKPVEKPMFETPVLYDEKNENTDGEELDEELQREIMDELKPKFKTPQTKTDTVTKEEKTVKKTTRKKKTDETQFAAPVTDNPTTTVVDIPIHKYEYKTIFIDLDNIDLLQVELNKLGENYWEIVNFEVIQSILPSKSKLFCILKRNKQ